MAVRRSVLFFVLSAVVLFSLLFAFRVRNEMADFEVNYRAGQRLAESETLYRTSDGHWQFKYFPFSAFLYLPLTWLPLTAAKACWFGLTVAASVSILAISSKIIEFKYDTGISPVLVAGLVMGRYLFREIQLGQINALITSLLLIVILILARSSGRSAGGGAVCGLATALKPYAVIMFPYFIVRRKWPALGAGLGVLVLAALSPALFYGWKGNLAVLGEWRSSLAASTPALLSSQDNISLLGLLLKWTHARDLSVVLYAIVVAGLGALAFLLVRKGRPLPGAIALEGFLLLALIPLLSPLGWDYTFLSFTPAVILIWRHHKKYARFWRGFLVVILLVISLSLYDLMGESLYAAFMGKAFLTPLFLILLGYLSYLRLKGHA